MLGNGFVVAQSVKGLEATRDVSSAALGAKASGDAPRSCPEAVRRTHVCLRDTGNIYRTWACDAAYHWDCRNSGAKRRCNSTHYSRLGGVRGKRAAWLFFNTSEIAAAAARGRRNVSSDAAPFSQIQAALSRVTGLD